MAFDLLDEHEQSELVRQWLRENAVSIAVGVLLGLALIFGWQQWKSHRAARAADAAAHYQALSDAIEAKRGASDIDTLANGLRKDFPGSPYAVFAAMQQADLAAQKGDTKAAAGDLDWAYQHADGDAMKALAGLRLARIKLASGDAQGTLTLLDALPQGDFAGLVDDVRGDALAKLDRKDEARDAYRNALTHLEARAPVRDFVQMKLDDLGQGKEKQGS
jgi:predicted negative regulator of RcsB-dependent stress response